MPKKPLKTQKTLKEELKKECFKLWKEKGFEKWGNKCEVCGGVATHPHHYIYRSQNGLLNYNLKNFIPLCPYCHIRIHRRPASEVKRIYDRIRDVRGSKWCEEIDELEKTHKSSFKTIGWLKEQLEILKS